MPSFSPPAVTTGPNIVTLFGSNWPASSTQAVTSQYRELGSSSSTVVFPDENGMSISPDSATALVTSC